MTFCWSQEKYGLGDCNEAGERLREFLTDHELITANAMFEHNPRRRYTWISPDGRTRNQIDYMAIRKQWKAIITDCKAYPGAVCDLDHVLGLPHYKRTFLHKEEGDSITKAKSWRAGWEESRGTKPLITAVELALYFTKRYFSLICPESPVHGFASAIEVSNRFDAVITWRSDWRENSRRIMGGNQRSSTGIS